MAFLDFLQYLCPTWIPQPCPLPPAPRPMPHLPAVGPIWQMLALASVLTVVLTARGYASEAIVWAVDQAVFLVARAFEVSLQCTHVQSIQTAYIFLGDGAEDHVIVTGALTSLAPPSQGLP